MGINLSPEPSSPMNQITISGGRDVAARAEDFAYSSSDDDAFSSSESVPF